ncbi:hypothetical protein IRB23M11_19290 [Alkalibacterium sp. m-11]|uniref:Uncharacterized protein n=1 Tax=Alkalibacterium indicireducens TaxID=398758 RepID=A0ABN1AI58_9LACT
MQVLEKHVAISNNYGACTPISHEKGTFEFGIGVPHDGGEVQTVISCGHSLLLNERYSSVSELIRAV